MSDDVNGAEKAVVEEDRVPAAGFGGMDAPKNSRVEFSLFLAVPIVCIFFFIAVSASNIAWAEAFVTLFPFTFLPSLIGIAFAYAGYCSLSAKRKKNLYIWSSVISLGVPFLTYCVLIGLFVSAAG